MTEIIKCEVMTSREIAELTGKQHNDVLKAIRAMEPAWVKVNGGNFSLVEYIDAKGEKRPMYELTKTECLYIATKFNDEARAKLVLRWEELELKERQNAPTLPDFTNPAEAARAWAAEYEAKQQALLENERLQLENKELKPKALFADAVGASQRSCLVAELAKILKQNGVDTGQNRLFKWLRENGYLGNKGEYYNQPTQKAMDMGLFELKKRTVNNPDGTVMVVTTTKVTPKGQIYFVNKLIEK